MIGARVCVLRPYPRVGTVIRIEPDGRWLVATDARSAPVWPRDTEPYVDPVLRDGDMLRGLTSMGRSHGDFRVTGVARSGGVWVSHVSGVADCRGVRRSRWGLWIDRDDLWRFDCV